MILETNNFESTKEESFYAYHDKIKVTIPKMPEYMSYNMFTGKRSENAQSYDVLSDCSSVIEFK